MKTISLVGMPGCGKTTIGRILADMLRLTFLDLDELIEKQGRTINEIFGKDGEKIFRKIETETLEKFLHNNPFDCVLSTGGGVVYQNCDVLKTTTTVVYILRDIEKIRETIDASTRPLLKNNPEMLDNLFKIRTPLYEEIAHITVSNNGDITQTVEEVIEKLKAVDL